MSRYSLNLRPLYDPNEQTGGEGFARGIAGAIALKQSEEAEDNARVAAGQVKTGETGVGDRFGGIVRKVKGIFGADGSPPVVAPADQPPASLVPLPTNPAMPAPPPRVARTMDEAMNMGRTPAPVSPYGASTEPAAPTATPVNPAARPSIANAIQPYAQHDTHGNSWSVDPLYAAKVQDAGRGVGDEEKIQSLIDAGMDPAMARAKVLNNVVRYDEQFGQKPRGGALSNTDYAARENLRFQHQKDLDALRASGRISAQQLSAERLRLQQEEAADRRQQAEERAQAGDVTRSATIAGVIDRGIPKDPIAQATATPEQKAGWDRKGRQRDAAIGAAVSGQQKLQNSHASADVVKARAQALQRSGKSRAEIAQQLLSEGYRVH